MPARAPRWRRSSSRDRRRTSPTVFRPRRSSRGAVLTPTPRSTDSGMGSRKSPTCSAGTTVSPSGLSASEASLAMSRFGPMPTEAVRLTASRIAALARRPMTSGGPTSRSRPVTSR